MKRAKSTVVKISQNITTLHIYYTVQKTIVSFLQSVKRGVANWNLGSRNHVHTRFNKICGRELKSDYVWGGGKSSFCNSENCYFRCGTILSSGKQLIHWFQRHMNIGELDCRVEAQIVLQRRPRRSRGRPEPTCTTGANLVCTWIRIGSGQPIWCLAIF